MPERVIAVGAENNGGVDVQARRGNAPGPGNFVSRQITEGPDAGKWGWFPAMMPQTQQRRNPLNLERWEDVPILGADGKPLYRLDPAAVETIERERGSGATHLPVMKHPEANDALKGQMAQLIESQRETNKTLNLLVQVMAQNVHLPIVGAATTTDVPVKRGRKKAE